jgi:hypothetical protein
MNSDFVASSTDDGERQNLFEHCVTNIVLETQEVRLGRYCFVMKGANQCRLCVQWSLILGRTDRDGAKIKGALDSFLPQEQMLAVISNMASEAEQRGRLLDALHLYELGEV